MLNRKFTNADVTIVIPLSDEISDLVKLLETLEDNRQVPARIIIVRTSVCFEGVLEKFKDKFPNTLRAIRTVSSYGEFPGGARNAGIKCVESELVAFLDVKTLPTAEWLDEALNSLNDGAGIVFGRTIFRSYDFFTECVVDMIFGHYGNRTVPGVVLRKAELDKIGTFYVGNRAGEDTEWMSRVGGIGIRSIRPRCISTVYTGLEGQNLPRMALKHLRNYSSAKDTPNLYRQRLFAIAFIYVTLVLMGLNWNIFVANLQESSPYFISNLTKSIAIIPLVIYILYRAFFNPLMRGATRRIFLPHRAIFNILLCVILDVTKVIAFTVPKSLVVRIIRIVE